MASNGKSSVEASASRLCTSGVESMMTIYFFITLRMMPIRRMVLGSSLGGIGGRRGLQKSFLRRWFVKSLWVEKSLPQMLQCNATVWCWYFLTVLLEAEGVTETLLSVKMERLELDANIWGCWLAESNITWRGLSWVTAKAVGSSNSWTLIKCCGRSSTISWN